MSSNVATSLTHDTSWLASLKLGFKYAREKTLLFDREQRGPLAVQRTFYPEGDVCHLYILHPPGGVVGGDRLEIKARIIEECSVLITTPGATKFYRSAGSQALQTQQLNIDGGSLEWFPQENIFFPGARVRLESSVNLSHQGKYIGWEINCLGRPANQERFTDGEIDLRLRISRGGKPLLIDRLVITDINSQQGIATLHNASVVATLVATNVNNKTLDDCRQFASGSPDESIGFTLIDDLLIGRYLGNSTENARNLFMQSWKAIRPSTLARKAVAPRIWAT